MRRSVRRAVTGIVATASAATVPLAGAMPGSAATPVTTGLSRSAAAQPQSAVATAALPLGCQPLASALMPTGQLTEVITVNEHPLRPPYWEDIYRSIAPAGTVTALTSTSTQWDRVNYPPVYLYSRQFFVRSGALYFGSTTYNTVKQTKSFTSRQVGSSWQPFRHLADSSDPWTGYKKAGSLYGVNSNTGTLHRYRVSEQTWGKPVLTHTGSKTGFGGIRSLTLAYQYRPWASDGQDALLATTSKGALLLITMPRTGSFAPRTTVLRSSTWYFDDLAVTNCGSGWALLAVKKSMKQAHLYYIPAYNGSNTRFTYVGRIGTSWSASRTAGFWSDAEVPLRQWNP
jgi:hypothetical protein